MTSKFTEQDNGKEYTPEEAALLKRRRVFINVRWLAILGVVLLTIIATRAFGITFPTLPVYIICGLVALYNLLLTYQEHRLQAQMPGMIIQRARTYSNITMFVDLVFMTTMLHFTGGIENPFIFCFVLPVIIASVMLRYTTVYALVTAAMLMVVITLALEYTGVVPHINLEGYASPTLYQEEGYIAAITVALATILYLTAYMTTAVSGELRKRQRQVVDLSEQLLQEKTAELNLAAEEVAKLEEERNRFLRFIGIAAHDLKAPLTAIQGFLWVMLGGYAGEVSEKQRNMLDRSRRRIDELLQLISDLLDIPRIETGQIVEEIKEISLRQVIKSSVEEQRDVAGEKGIVLKAKIPAKLTRIRGSGTRLQQVLTNLLCNAINYTPEGTVTVTVTEHDQYLEVAVSDTGIGIPAEDLPKIFDDFFRASNVNVKGTGLGLSIAKRIVEAHGGQIWCHSPNPDTHNGTKFVFTLPQSTKVVRRKAK